MTTEYKKMEGSTTGDKNPGFTWCKSLHFSNIFLTSLYDFSCKYRLAIRGQHWQQLNARVFTVTILEMVDPILLS